MKLFFALLAFILAFSGCSTVGAKPDASLGDVPSQGPVGRTIKRNASKFEACGRDATSVQTGTTQHIQLKFKLDAEGNVTKAQIDGMTEPDPDLYSCVLHALKHIKFPEPADPQQLKVLTYPLIVKPE